MFAKFTLKEFYRMLEQAGISINSSDPDSFLVDSSRLPQVAREIILHGTLGAGRTWMQGLWDCRALDQMVCKLAKTGAYKRLLFNPEVAKIKARQYLPFWVTQSQNIANHYNTGVDFFREMLGPLMMVYSCGYWVSGGSLYHAQQAKLELISKKLSAGGLVPSQRVLDIGCGFGTLCGHLASVHQVNCKGISVSTDQVEYAKDRYFMEGKVRIIKGDYLDLVGWYHHIVSVGMFEHVGPRNYRRFFCKVRDLLWEDGIFLLHTIGAKTQSFLSDPFTQEYIFPEGYIPSRRRIEKASRGILEIRDWHAFGSEHYDRTLLAWYDNLLSGWFMLNPKKYSDDDRRMWEFYLLMYAGIFRAGILDVWQIVFAHPGKCLNFPVTR